ncbi:MAG TPA: FtsX-like permease family protein [Chloroflexia bacterium]|nr:FtsX-like permease family protein [Chloroflexia bacterium]
MSVIGLYFKYAWRSIWRGGQRTFFAILCVAVGVASIVALQTTGLTISDSVAGDAKAEAGADVLVTNRQGNFTQQDLDQVATLKQNNTISDYTTRTALGLTILKPDGSKSNDYGNFYSAFAIDSSKYPYYGKTGLENPAGKSMRDVLTGPGQIVLNSKMAKSISAKVGDTIKVTGQQPGQLKVVGILNSKATSPDNQAEFLGYGYITQETAKGLFNPESLLPGTVFVKTVGTADADNKARDAINQLSPRYNAVTSAERNDQVKKASDGIRDLLIYVGLISLLIGSVGVVNTMLVVVGRRSTEIATIKALGMESGQTVRIFVIEAAILGVLGSIIGIALGEILALGTSRAAEGFVNQTLDYRFYWSPIFMGLAVGIITAIVFGLLPAYSASKIPPAQVLRQKVNALPRISVPATLFIIVIMTLIMGTMAGIILNGNILTGIIVAFVTLISCAILVLIFSGILWLIGKLPLPFGLNYKMARRNLSRGRAKSATTVLVLMVGVFAMAIVLILSSSLKDTIKNTLEQSFGYNLQVAAKDDTQASQITQALDQKQVPGLEKYLPQAIARVRWISANGISADELLQRRLDQIKNNPSTGQAGPQQGNQPPDMSYLLGIKQNDLLSIAKQSNGSLFSNDDQVTISKEVQDAYGIKIGDKLVYQDLLTQKQFSLTVTGVVENKNFIVNSGPAQTTLNRIEQIPGHQNAFELTVNRDQVDTAEKYLQSTFQGADVSNLSFITNVINQILDNVTAFPLLLGFLCLISGAVLIANNVALAVLERRTEMGVMKSLGADNTRVLSIINLESLIIGFVGGLFGLGLAVTLASILVQNFGTADNPASLSVSPLISIGMVALALALAVIATMLSAFGAATEKPMVVLRYE